MSLGWPRTVKRVMGATEGVGSGGRALEEPQGAVSDLSRSTPTPAGPAPLSRQEITPCAWKGRKLLVEGKAWGLQQRKRQFLRPWGQESPTPSLTAARRAAHSPDLPPQHSQLGGPV